MSTTAAQPQESQTPAPAVYNPTTTIARQVREFVERKTLTLPGDYSAENALKAAWLTLQAVKDSTGKPALQVCTKESIANALLDMVVQGLNPAKKQCYFIAYGTQLSCQRSYFGDMALAERVEPGIEIYYGVIWDGDEVEFEIVRGRRTITKHVSKLENQGKAIKGAYCGVLGSTGEDLGAEIMTIEQIKKSWAQSKTYKPEGGNTPHHSFPDQMALRTVIRRRCKPIINASSDALLLESVRRQDDEALLAEIAEETSNANGEVLALGVPEASVEAVPGTESAEVQPGQDPGF